MEELHTAALDQIGLEGPEGCTPQRLWSLLLEALGARGACIAATAVKQQLWLLLSSDSDVQLCQWSVIEDADQADRVKKKDAPAQKLVPVGADIATSPDDAEAQGLRLVGSEWLRNSSLGMHDESLSVKEISAIQRTTLEIVGRGRQDGALRNVLCAAANLAPKNFHYVMKTLEARGLVIMSPIVTSRQKRDHSLINTSVVHLRRFAPCLLPGQYLKQVEDAAGLFTVDNDEERIQQISRQLCFVPNRMLLEQELKHALGYTGKAGHRAWSKVKRKAVDMGLLHVYLGALEERSVMLCKLLKPWEDLPGSSKGKKGRGVKAQVPQDAEGDDDEDGGTSAERLTLSAECGLEEQVLQVLLNAGAEGISYRGLMRMLHLDPKRHLPLVALALLDHRRALALATMPAVPAEVLHSSGIRIISQRQAGADRAATAASGPEQQQQQLALSKKPSLTRVAQDRLAVIDEVLDREGFILFLDAANMFRGPSDSSGGRRSGPDRSTIYRILQRCIDDGAAYSVTVEVPVGKDWRKVGMRQAEVLVRAGIPLDQSLQAKIEEAEAETEDAAKVVKPTQLHMNRLIANGFYTTRALRARLLHIYLCRLVGLAGHTATQDPDKGKRKKVPSDQLAFGAVSTPAARPVFLFSLGSSREHPAQPLALTDSGQAAAAGDASDTELASDEPPQQAPQAQGEPSHTFELGFAWDSMPLSLFVQVVGTTAEPALLRQLQAQHSKLGTVPEHHKSTLLADYARRRMAGVLDVLRRMRLVTATLGDPASVRGQKRAELQDSAVYAVEPVAWAQEQGSLVLSQQRAGQPSSSDAPEWKSFDLDRPEALEQYWSRLEFHANDRTEDIQRWFPYNAAPEMASKRAWTRDQPLSHPVLHKARFSRHKQRLEHLKTGLPPPPKVSTANPRRKMSMEEKHSKQREAYRRKRRKDDMLAAGTEAAAGAVPASPQHPLAAEVPAPVSDQAYRLGAPAADGEPSLPHGAKGSRMWAAHEDKFILHCWCRWHAQQGQEYSCFRLEQRTMPPLRPVTERQARRRIGKLQVNDQTKYQMGRLQQLIQAAHAKAHPVQDGQHEAAEHGKSNAERASEGQLATCQVLALQRPFAADPALAQPSAKRQRVTAPEDQGDMTAATAGGDLSTKAIVEAALRTDPRYANIVATGNDRHGQLFPVNDEHDRRRHDEAWGLIDDIIASAPLRYRAGEHRASRAGRHSSSLAPRPLHRRNRRMHLHTHPDPLAAGAIPLDESEGGDEEAAGRQGIEGQEDSEQSFLAMQSLPQALRQHVGERVMWHNLPLPPDGAPIPASVATAMGLIKGLLASEKPGGAAEGAAAALCARFSQDDIICAFGHLIKQGHLYSGQAHRPFHLTKRFHACLQVLGIPPDTFPAARSASRMLRQSLASASTSAATPEARANSAGLVIAADEDIPHGLVAAALPRMLAGELSLPFAQAKTQAPDHSSTPATLVQLPHVDVRITACSGANLLKSDSSATALLHSSDLAESEDVNMTDATSSNEVDSTLVAEATRAVSAAGAHGLTLQQLTRELSSQLPAEQEATSAAARHVAECMVLDGAAQRVPGAGDWALIAPEHASAFHAQDPAQQDKTVLLQPWVSHMGVVHSDLYQSLARRAVSAVIRSPGLSEAAMHRALEALLPMQATALLDSLVEQKLITRRVVNATAPGPPAIFGGPAPKQAQVRHYFANPQTCMTAVPAA
ncbi:hypothetical protein WJX73_010666 [Symbiochloris irregularis]|uniref:B-block binding subunit of TFIIIC domain-containing protein n=1 Tax=Symbiochloris irregularis TaxID=706552 RepID=A0AAW1NQD6_9CHLO